MRLVLNDDDAISIPLDGCAREAWHLQYDRACHSGMIETFRQRLARCFAASLAECLDADLQPPTDSQLQYATSIARELGISLPSEALRFRGAMSEFINRFAETFREQRKQPETLT
jgi:hypothetical protein